jgi:hypothetical protein
MLVLYFSYSYTISHEMHSGARKDASMTQWRKQGDEQWQPAGLPLPGDDKHELVFVRSKHFNRFTCASCDKSLSETPYFWWKSVPQTAFTILNDKRYCTEHSPIPLETQEGPTIWERIAQRFEALEQRVAELEAAQKFSDQGYPDQQKGDEES